MAATPSSSFRGSRRQGTEPCSANTRSAGRWCCWPPGCSRAQRAAALYFGAGLAVLGTYAFAWEITRRRATAVVAAHRHGRFPDHGDPGRGPPELPVHARTGSAVRCGAAVGHPRRAHGAGRDWRGCCWGGSSSPAPTTGSCGAWRSAATRSSSSDIAGDTSSVRSSSWGPGPSRWCWPPSRTTATSRAPRWPSRSPRPTPSTRSASVHGASCPASRSRTTRSGAGVYAVAKHAFFFPWFLLGGYLGVAVAAAGALGGPPPPEHRPGPPGRRCVPAGLPALLGHEGVVGVHAHLRDRSTTCPSTPRWRCSWPSPSSGSTSAIVLGAGGLVARPRAGDGPDGDQPLRRQPGAQRPPGGAGARAWSRSTSPPSSSSATPSPTCSSSTRSARTDPSSTTASCTRSTRNRPCST